MINLYDSHLLDILPIHLKSDAHAQAFCYAVDNQVKKLLDRSKKIAIWSDLSNVDETLLDYLAVELRTQYYSPDLEVSVKRKLIENTLIWYEKAGTVFALEELITSVFGEGQEVEWYEYGGNPYHFKIVTTNPNITGDAIQLFDSIIEQIKRKTAVLDAVEIALNATMNTYYGFAIHIGDFIFLRQEG